MHMVPFPLHPDRYAGALQHNFTVITIWKKSQIYVEIYPKKLPHFPANVSPDRWKIYN